MNNKVVLPRDVAEAIELRREQGFNNYDMFVEYQTGQLGDRTHDFISKHGFDWYLSALVNGYQVAQTPEEKVREYYEKCRENWLKADEENWLVHAEYLNGQSTAIALTLNLLGITIEGINA